MSIELTAIKTIEKTDINAIADEWMEIADDNKKVIDHGDHMVNIWKDEAGQTKIAIQATGVDVTLITLAA